MLKFNLEKFNTMVRNTLDRFYLTRTADNFFKIDEMLRVCREHNLTSAEVTALIEMQNVIVMG